MQPNTHPGGSLFAVGDIHGCYDPLRRLIESLPLRPGRDRLLFIGDYIDRGPHSFEVVEYLIALGKNWPGTVFLKGNHELMLENYLGGGERLFYLQNGGLQTMESYLSRRGSQAGPPLPPEHLLFFDRLVTRYESATHYFAHAGMRPGVPLERQKEEDLLWIREDFIDSRHDFGKPVVFGHTAFAEPLVQPNKIGIDTGAVYGNRLTCVRLPEMQFYQSASAGPGKGKTG